MTLKMLSSKKFFENKTKNFRKKSYFSKTTKILKNENVKTFLHNFQKQNVVVPIDKPANNF